MSTGKYHKQLSKVFSFIGILFILCIVIGVFLNISSYVENRYQNTLKQSVFSNNMLTEVTLSTVSSTLTSLTQDPVNKLWANSSSRSQYYYNAIMVRKKLDLLGVHRTSIPFFPSITSSRDNFFVITVAGSYDKKKYFQEETSLTDEDVAEIFEYYSHATGDLTIPYYENNQLKEIYYFYQPYFVTNQLIYIMKIPRNSLLSANPSQKFIIYEDNNILAYSHNDEKTKSSLDSLFLNIMKREISWDDTTNDSFKVKNNDLFVSSFTKSNWKIAYVYDHIGLSPQQMILYILLPSMGTCFFVFFFFKKTVNWLYSPMKSVINEVIDNKGNKNSTDTVLDEFELLNQNATTAKDLAKDLQVLINQNNSLISQKFYRDLIYGVDTRKNVLYKNFELNDHLYCVALIEFSDTEESYLENDIFFSKNIIFSHCQSIEHLNSVNINQNTCAVIICTSNLEEAKNIMLTISNTLPENQIYKISLSNLRKGLKNINQCYKEAQKILEYKYLYLSTEILTAQQVYLNESTDYNYPIITENRIIQSMAQGKDTALEVFDQLIRDNFINRDLSPDSLRNFIFALLSTLNRFFQELKTQPEELLGHQIMLDDLYVNWNQPNIISKIRSIIKEIIDAVILKSSTADNRILAEMQNFIYNNYSSDIMLNDMADELGISAKYCSNLFKKLSDDNFKNFLNKYRVERAKEIILKNTNIKVTDISTMVGFNSSNTFIRVFSKYTGTTPKAFANQVNQTNNV